LISGMLDGMRKGEATAVALVWTIDNCHRCLGQFLGESCWGVDSDGQILPSGVVAGLQPTVKVGITGTEDSRCVNGV
jgi:hypothetical protein